MSTIDVGLEGYVGVTIRRTDGSVRHRHRRKNAVQQNLANEVAAYLFSGNANNIPDVNLMTITHATNSTWNATELAITSGTAQTFGATFTKTFTCASLASGTETYLTSVSLKNSTPNPDTLYASHTFSGSGIGSIQSGETVEIDYTLSAGAATGVSDLLRKSTGAAFEGSGPFARVQYLWADGTSTVLAQVKGTPSMSGTSSSGNQANDSTNHTATVGGGVIVLHNNNGTANDDDLPSMDSQDASNAYLSSGPSLPGSPAAALANADLTNVKSGDKLDLKFTLTITPS